MLLKFSISNYKSFLDEAVLNMIPAQKQKDLNYSILKTKVKAKTIKALSSSVIYGPNASGKSNIIGALETFRAIVSRGNIRNPSGATGPNHAMYRLELIPNNTLKHAKSVRFRIVFVTDDSQIDYALELDLGLFLDVDHKRKITRETLYINKELVFERNENHVEVERKHLFKPIDTKRSSITDRMIDELTRQGLKDDELFLSNGFKNIVNQDLANQVIQWFSNKLHIIYRVDQSNITEKHEQGLTFNRKQKLTNLARAFGAETDEIGFFSTEESSIARLSSLIKVSEKDDYVLPADVFESYGTIRFLNLFTIIERTFFQGGTLLIDEFDASIHPMALLSIINTFHNDEQNRKNAQLIFNTHNPIFLKPSVFRRDEIKFIERDDRGKSTIYSLADFKTSGESGVRKTTDYMKNYFINQYGAIKDIDLSSFFDVDFGGNDEKKN